MLPAVITDMFLAAAFERADPFCKVEMYSLTRNKSLIAGILGRMFYENTHSVLVSQLSADEIAALESTMQIELTLPL
jgi:hypothetical protein